MKEKKSRKKKEHKMSLAFGGQAVLEGVLMRSKNYTVVCVRKEDGSTQKVTEKLNPRSARHRILRAPFIRGIYALLQTMYIGVKALYVSANISLEKEGEKIKPSEMAIAVIIAMLMGIGLFAVLPYFTTHWLNLKGLVFNVIEGIIRLVIFILYLAIISLLPSFKRVLQYHGAEHTAINMLESGGGPIDEKTKGHKRFHPRCGTSFILIVLLISIIIFSLMPDLGWLINFSYRILLIPVIAGLAYEILKLSDKYKDSRIMKGFVAPGVWLQRLTTKEPTQDMVEVALEAVNEVKRLEDDLEKATPKPS
jgi:uncharacterized protein YqhQ